MLKISSAYAAIQAKPPALSAAYAPRLNRKPAAPRYWPFGELTLQQQQQRSDQHAAMAADELRRLPTVFGQLDEVAA